MTSSAQIGGAEQSVLCAGLDGWARCLSVLIGVEAFPRERPPSDLAVHRAGGLLLIYPLDLML